MKILICTGIYPPDIGGPATYSKLLKDKLPKLGVDVSVLSFGEVRHLPKIFRHISYFFKVLKLGKRADLIFAQDPVSVGFPASLASKILKKKFVLKIVGDYAWEQGRQRFGVTDSLDDFVNKKYSLSVELFKKIQRFSANSASIIVTPSKYLKDIVSKWDINENKIKVVYNSIEIPKPKISKEDAREKFGLSGFVLVSVARLVPWKGLDSLIEIMPEVLKQIPDAKLVIIGDGPEEKKLKSKISDLRVGDNVFMVGRVSRGEVLSYLGLGDIFVLNTSYEGLSHLLLEAMGVGIPVVTTKVGGNPELIDNGESGILVEYDNKVELMNAILDLYKNSEKKEEMVKNAKNKMKKFSEEEMIKNIHTILKNII